MEKLHSSIAQHKKVNSQLQHLTRKDRIRPLPSFRASSPADQRLPNVLNEDANTFTASTFRLCKVQHDDAKWTFKPPSQSCSHAGRNTQYYPSAAHKFNQLPDLLSRLHWFLHMHTSTHRMQNIFKLCICTAAQSHRCLIFIILWNLGMIVHAE